MIVFLFIICHRPLYSETTHYSEQAAECGVITKLAIMLTESKTSKSESHLRRRYTWTTWLVGTPSVLCGLFIGITLLQIHWALSLLVILVTDYTFQYVYNIAYRNEHKRYGFQPGSAFYFKAVLVQLPIVAIVIVMYLVIITGLRGIW